MSQKTETTPDTYPTPEHGWTCFHCGETFAGDAAGHRAAQLHFGASIHHEPKCQISAHGSQHFFCRVETFRQWIKRAQARKEPT